MRVCRLTRIAVCLVVLLATVARADETLTTESPAEPPGETTVRSETLEFRDPLGVVRLGWPAIGERQERKERELAPGLSHEIRFTTQKEGPAAVLVSTRIREELPKDDRVLERIEPKYRAFKTEHGDDVIVAFDGKSPNRMLEFGVAGGEYQDMFPYVVGGQIGGDGPPASVTMSHFFVDSGRMFEMAVFLPNDDRSTRKDLFNRARKVCQDWRTTVAIKE
jgi:hypothetical protein